MNLSLTSVSYLNLGVQEENINEQGEIMLEEENITGQNSGTPLTSACCTFHPKNFCVLNFMQSLLYFVL